MTTLILSNREVKTLLEVFEVVLESLKDMDSTTGQFDAHEALVKQLVKELNDEQ